MIKGTIKGDRSRDSLMSDHGPVPLDWELDAHYGYWIGDETGGIKNIINPTNGATERIGCSLCFIKN